MSDEIRKDRAASEGKDLVNKGGVPDDPGKQELPDREEVMPKDHEVYTPQGGGAGTGSGPIQEVAAVGDKPTLVPAKASDGVILPQVGPEAATAEALGIGAEGGGLDQADGVPERPEVSSFRLLMTLGVAGAIAGALLVFVFQWSDPIIREERARVLQEAVTEVLQGPARFDTVFVLEGELVTEVPEGEDKEGLDKVFLGYDEGGNPIGFALAADGFGFQDIISVIFGYDPGTGQLLGMKVLGHKETPGLGDKIVKDTAFVSAFRGLETRWSPEDSLFIRGISKIRSSGDPDEVVMITGVTISSKTVVKIINERILDLRDLLAAYVPAGGGVAGMPAGGQEEGR